MNPSFARIALAALACAAMFTAAGAGDAHEGHDHSSATAAAKPAADAAHDAMMAEMMKNAMPGPEHKALESMVGTWKAKVKSWAAPGEPQLSEGTMVNTMILGGRVLEGRYTGTFFGQPMTGVSLMGYDNAKKEYWSFWMDDVSTMVMMQTGGPMKDRTMVLSGTGDGPDGKPTTYTSTLKLVDENSHVYTMTFPMDGKQVPMMELVYSR